MKPVDLHREWMEDEEYRREYAEMEPATRFAIMLIRFRNEAGLTQTELAHRMGKDQAWISRIEAAKENPTLKTLGQFAYALERDPAEFLKRIEEDAPVTA